MDELKKLYAAVSNKVNVGSYDDFALKMGDTDSRKRFYEAVKTKGVNLGDYGAYEQRLGSTGGAQAAPYKSILETPPNEVPKTTKQVEEPKKRRADGNSGSPSASASIDSLLGFEPKVSPAFGGKPDPKVEPLIKAKNQPANYAERLDGMNDRGLAIRDKASKMIRKQYEDQGIKDFRITPQQIDEQASQMLDKEKAVMAADTLKKINGTKNTKEQRGYWSHFLEDKLAISSTKLGEMVAGIPESLYDIASIPQNAFSALTGIDITASSDKFKKNTGLSNPVLDLYMEETDKLQKRSEKYDEKYIHKGAFESFKNGNVVDGFEQLGSGIAESAGVSIAMMAGGTALSMGKLAATTTTAMFNDKMREVQKENPKMNAFETNVKALGLAGAETVFSAVSSKALGDVYKDILLKEGQQVGSEVFKKGVVEMYKAALKKYGGLADALGEGIEEVATTITQNLINGKPALEGVAESFLQGAGGGAVYGAPINAINLATKFKDGSNNRQIDKIIDLDTNQYKTITDAFVPNFAGEVSVDKIAIVKRAGSLKKLTTELDKSVAAGTMSEQDATAHKQEFLDTNLALSKTGDLQLNDTNNAKAVGLIRRKEALVAEIKNMDEALANPKREEVVAINDELISMVEEVLAERKAAQASKEAVKEVEVDKPKKVAKDVAEEIADGDRFYTENLKSDKPMEVEQAKKYFDNKLAYNRRLLGMYQNDVAENPDNTFAKGKVELLKKVVNELKTPAEMKDVKEATPEDYSIAMSGALTSMGETDNKVNLQVDPVSLEDAKQIVADGGKLFMTSDGKSGAYVKADGYMGGLFKDPSSDLKEVGKVLQQARTEAGGKYFDAYGTKLEDIYKKNGFIPVARVAFNEEYAPEGWDAQDSPLKDKPDVVFFAYDPSSKVKVGGGEVVTDYDAGIELAKNYKSDEQNKQTTPAAEQGTETGGTGQTQAGADTGESGNATGAPKKGQTLSQKVKRVFGLNAEQTKASVVVMNKVIETMAKRAGITVAEMEAKITLKKATKNTIKKLTESGKALFQMAGQNANLKEELRDKFRMAQELEKTGKTAREIWMATGWEKGADGKWRVEFDDSQMQLKSGYESMRGFTLDEAIDYKELFELYPELKAVKFSVIPRLGSMKGAYMPSKNLIMINGELSAAEVKSTLLHEIQHIIQGKEGFATGGTPKMAIDYLNTKISRLTVAKNVPSFLVKAAEKLSNSLFTGIDVTASKENFIKEIKNAKNQLSRGEWDAYQSIAGEVEARNVQTRMNMSAQDRKNTPLSETESKILPKEYSDDPNQYENIGRDEQIVLFQGQQGAMIEQDGDFIVYAMTDANVSTPMHELAHVYEHYLTDAERKTILKSANHTEWSRDTSEHFARGFEKYLSEGKAPTPELKVVFENFKNWLTNIYNGVTGSEIDVELTKEAMEVFDSMLGLDKIITPESIKDKAQTLADKTRTLKINSSIKDSMSKLSSTGVFEVAWDASIELAAKTIEAGGSVAQGVNDAIQSLKNSDWYKNLSTDGKKEADKIMQDRLIEELTNESTPSEFNIRKLMAGMPVLSYLDNVWYEKVVKKAEDNVAKFVAKAATHNNKLVRGAAQVSISWFNGLPRTENQLFERRKLTGSQEEAFIVGQQMTKELQAIVNFDKESAERVHRVLDQEIYEEFDRLTYDELTTEEKALHDALKKVNEDTHELNYKNGFISEETYNKFKGKYIARAYEEFEQIYADGEGEKDIFVDTSFFGKIYKERKEIDQWKIDNKIKDPIYLTVNRMIRTQRNLSIKNYADYLITSGVAIDGPKEGYIEMKGARFTTLNGKFLPYHASEDFTGYLFTNKYMDKIYDGVKGYDKLKARQFLKKYHTTWSPLVQVGNFMSNHAFAFCTGINVIELWGSLPSANKSIKNQDEDYKYLVRNGIVSSSLVQSDLVSYGGSKQSSLTFAQETKLSVGGTLAKADAIASKLYSGSDDIMKVASFKALVKSGYSRKEAVEKVYSGFQNYATVGKVWDLASKTPIVGNAYIKFQADLMRIMKNAALKRPLSTAAFMASLKLVTLALSMQSGEDEDEREIREGRAFIPKVNLGFTKIPLVAKVGGKEINLARFVAPYYDYDTPNKDWIESTTRFMPFQLQTVQDAEMGQESISLEAPDVLLGGLTQAFIQNRDFRNKSVSDPYATRFKESGLTESEKIANKLNYVARSVVPMFSTAQDAYLAAMYGEDFYGRTKTTPDIFLSKVMKVQTYGKEELKKTVEGSINSIDFEAKIINNKIKSVQKKFDRDLGELDNRVAEGTLTSDKASRKTESLTKEYEQRYNKYLDDLVKKQEEINTLIDKTESIDGLELLFKPFQEETTKTKR